MNGVMIIRALLAAHSPLTALVPAANIRAGTVPVGVMPAVGIKEISRVETDTVSRGQTNVMVIARIQVTVYAGGTGGYMAKKALIQAAKLGPGAHTGVIAGATVRSVLRDIVGPDFDDDAAKVYEQSRDFKVTYIEPN